MMMNYDTRKTKRLQISQWKSTGFDLRPTTGTTRLRKVVRTASDDDGV